MKQVSTYNDNDKNGRAGTWPPKGKTLGGYTNYHVVTEHFAIIIPKSYPLDKAGPVMCSGVTLFDPLVRYGAMEGTRVAIVGIGGLGQMGKNMIVFVSKLAVWGKVSAISRVSKPDPFVFGAFLP